MVHFYPLLLSIFAVAAILLLRRIPILFCYPRLLVPAQVGQVVFTHRNI